MRGIVKVFLNISTISFLSLNQANANINGNNEDQLFILNSSIENISQNQTESNRQILDLQNKLESLTRKLDTINSTREAPKVPAGTVVAFAGKTIPKGWLLCDGKVISRKGEYQALFDSIGTAHGQGDGSTTFHLPDYRGLFLRGVLNNRSTNIEPDAINRVAANIGGNSGNQVGSYQLDDFKTHNHSVENFLTKSNTLSISGSAYPNIDGKRFTTTVNGNHSHQYRTNNGNSRFEHGGGTGMDWETTKNSSESGNHSHSVDITYPRYYFNTSAVIPSLSITGNIGNTGNISETRPKNSYVYYIIKY